VITRPRPESCPLRLIELLCNLALCCAFRSSCERAAGLERDLPAAERPAKVVGDAAKTAITLQASAIERIDPRNAEIGKCRIVRFFLAGLSVAVPASSPNVLPPAETIATARPYLCVCVTRIEWRTLPARRRTAGRICPLVRRRNSRSPDPAAPRPVDLKSAQIQARQFAEMFGRAAGGDGMMPMWLGWTRRKGGQWAAWLISIMFGSLVVMADTAARHDMASAAEQLPGWGRYRDQALGMAFDFPAHIFSLKSAEQGREGVVFSTIAPASACLVSAMSRTTRHDAI
jgi:hypothetical protein